MAGLNIGDVFMRVLADMTGFEADVTKAATKAGDKAGTTMGQRMRTGVTRGLSAVGAGAGLLFGVAARGAAELTDAMARFQAETGATSEELDRARKSVLELSKTNIHSFAEIADTQAALRTQMGLTQEQAEANTEAFLKYGTATGQVAADAVAGFDDILDSWGLTADRANGLMDQLIVSHQKYGGVIADNQKTLAALAPSMKAANFEIDDGIALLNLFGAKGIDANTASAAFAKSLTKVKSPAELQQLIDEISATEDPFLRAEKAANLFGARAGAKLANALANADLDDYKVGMEEAAGATEKAAKAIEDTPFNKLKMALRSIATPAIEAGQSFGPLILALSQLGGGKLVAAVTSALGGIAGALGSRLVTPLTDSLAAGLERAGVSSRVNGVLTTLGGKWGGVLGKGLMLGLVVALAANASDIRKTLDDTFHSIVGSARAPLQDVGDWVNNLPWPLGPKGAPDWAQIEHKTSTGAANVNHAVAASLTKDDDVQAAAATMAAPIPGEVKKAKDKAVLIGSRTPTELAQAILDKQGIVGSAMQALKTQMETELTPAQNAVRNIGFLVSKEFGQGIHDGRSGVRRLTEQLRTTGETELRKFIAGGGRVGKQAMDALNKGLHDKNPAVRAEARRIKNIIEGGVKANTKPAGTKAGADVRAGLNSQSGPVGTAARRLGVRVATEVLKGVMSFRSQERAEQRASSGAKAGGGPVYPGMASGGSPQVPFAYRVNERGEELFVPEVRGRILTASEARSILSARTAPMAGGGQTIHLETYGLPIRAETPLEVARQVRRVNSGIIAPYSRPTYKRY